MHRFFVHPETLATKKAGVLCEAMICHQLSRVLRARVGDRVILLPDDGTETEIELGEIGKKEISFRVIETRKNHAEPRKKITLFQAVPKIASKFESVLQHGTEIGISRFVPLISARTQGKVRNTTRYEMILKEAAEQSARGRIPTLCDAITLATLTKNLPQNCLVADSYRREPRLADLLPRVGNETEISIVIGPEGGFSAEEIEVLTSAGAIPFSLGPRVLRTETAGLAVASALFFG